MSNFGGTECRTQTASHHLPAAEAKASEADGIMKRCLVQKTASAAAAFFGITCTLILSAQTPEVPTLPVLDRSLQIITIPVWPNAAPDSDEAKATLTVFPPTLEASVGTAVIVAPGGGYQFLSSNIEGRQVADWFAARGVTAFVLKYRFGSQHIFPIPIDDMQQAIRVVRSLQKHYRYLDDRIGVIGFSAGGHLAAVAATTFHPVDPGSPDPIRQLSDKPNFVVLGYAAINVMQRGSDGSVTYCTLLKIPQEKCRDFPERYVPTSHVTGSTPPTFLFSTSDDHVVPVEASVSYYTAL